MIRQFSAGGVVYKKEAGNTLFLLKRNSLSPGYYASGEWSLPKGWLDDSGPDQPVRRLWVKKELRLLK
jgi:predicted NUDIX family NTP pyrophosphohydrolase